MTEVLFRDLSGMDEFRAAEGLQRAVWGEGDLPDPADLMMVIQAEGGLVGGAFVAGRLLGYVFGFPTRDPQVQHSHRLAVLPEARGLGLGAALIDAALEVLRDQPGVAEAYLGAQSHATEFYTKLGFAVEGEEFLDAGIPHRHMRRAL